MNLRLITQSALLCTLLGACTFGSSTESTNSDSTSPESTENSSSGDTGLTGTLGQLAKGLEEAAKKVEDYANTTIEPVDFRTLKDMLPSSVAGLDQHEAMGEKVGASGFNSSHAEAEYYLEDDPRRIHIKIMDVGSMTSMVAFGMSWLNLSIDKESSNGFERTTKIGGHPALQKFEKNGDYSSGETQVVVANRYIVEVKGTNVPFSDIEAAVKSIDLNKLESMKDEGVVKTE